MIQHLTTPTLQYIILIHLATTNRHSTSKGVGSHTKNQYNKLPRVAKPYSRQSRNKIRIKTQSYVSNNAHSPADLQGCIKFLMVLLLHIENNSIQRELGGASLVIALYTYLIVLRLLVCRMSFNFYCLATTY